MSEIYDNGERYDLDREMRKQNDKAYEEHISAHKKAKSIAFAGKAGSGKTTLAKHLEMQGYQRLSFADPMREIVQLIYPGIDKSDPRYRELMQKLGTDWFRSFDEDVWLNILMRRVGDNPVVVDDVRFPNEVQALYNAGFVVFFLECPEEVRVMRILERDGFVNKATVDHKSETSLDDFRPNWLNVVNSDMALNKFLERFDGMLKS